ncbi:MAG TPA: hypothetical protein VN612_05125 [Acidobacteriaceae bacterium]|nr:hypothetical protein [Acidobacteriaceae bacterium]
MAARTWSKWSHVIAGAVFCLLYFPFDSHPWAWPIAVGGSYTAFAFAIGLGLSLTNADDLFGEPRIPEYVATLLPHHVLILAPVTLVAYLMLRAVPFLPSWMTEHLPRIGSVWLLCGLVLFYFVGVWEGEWLSGKIRSQREKLDI